ncbi:MAG: HEAT repeat domain-containing protein [Planctomycetota bacterium]
MKRSLLLLLVLLNGCGRPGAPEPTQAPPKLVPCQTWLEELAASGPAPPGEERRAELQDLMLTGFATDLGARLSERALQRLLQEKEAYWILEEGLLHDDAAVREQAAVELGRLGHRASILPLLARLKYELDPDAKIEVATALARLGNDAGLPDLLQLMNAGPTAEHAGLNAIELCDLASVELSEEPSYQDLGKELQTLSDRWVETGISSFLPEEAPDPEVQARVAAHLMVLGGAPLRPVDDARFALSRSGQMALPLLRRTVLASELYLRSHSLEIIRTLGKAARSLGPTIMPLLSDPLSRGEAARTLGALGITEAAPRVIAMLSEPDPEIRTAAAASLGPLGARESIPALRERMLDEQESMDVRVMAAFSLALFELDRPARDFLLERKRQQDYHGPTLDELLDRVTPNNRTR